MNIKRFYTILFSINAFPCRDNPFVDCSRACVSKKMYIYCILHLWAQNYFHSDDIHEQYAYYIMYIYTQSHKKCFYERLLPLCTVYRKNTVSVSETFYGT